MFDDQYLWPCWDLSIIPVSTSSSSLQCLLVLCYRCCQCQSLSALYLHCHHWRLRGLHHQNLGHWKCCPSPSILVVWFYLLSHLNLHFQVRPPHSNHACQCHLVNIYGMPIAGTHSKSMLFSATGYFNELQRSG